MSFLTKKSSKKTSLAFPSKKTGGFDKNYHQLLEELQLESLADRRERLRLGLAKQMITSTNHRDILPPERGAISARDTKRAHTLQSFCCGARLRKSSIPHMTSLINPRPAGGGRLNAPPPSGFSRIAKKRRRAAPTGFHPLYPHLFRNFCENFDPMPCEVRSPGQVKWPNYKITFQSRHGYNVSGKVMKLSEYDEVTSAYKT